PASPTLPLAMPASSATPLVTPLDTPTNATTPVTTTSTRAAAAKRTKPIAPPAVPHTSRLTVMSNPPGATVTVDGRALGRTPLRSASLSPGRHLVSLTLHGYQKRDRNVDLVAAESQTLELDLPRASSSAPQAQPGYLTVRTIPWAHVYEGGRMIGTTPLAN